MIRQVIEILDLLDSPAASGERLADFLRSRGAEEVAVQKVAGNGGSTDFVRVIVPGSRGRGAGGSAPTLGVIGRLGGVGARPDVIGYVSDGDGATCALAVALKLVEMHRHGDVLPGDVIVTTHVCPDAPPIPHEPVPFMGSPVDMDTMNRLEVDPAMEGILTIDATKGNWVVNSRGIAISPTVKEGWILRVDDRLLDLARWVTGRPPVVLPITMQDITPYGNGVFHVNSILQPATATSAPVVGIAITAEVPVPGCVSGASHEIDIELAARFAVETAKGFGAGTILLHDQTEFDRLVALYGGMGRLQTLGGRA